MPGQASPFSPDQRIWIVKKFGELKSATLVRRAFRIEFKVNSPSKLPHQMDQDGATCHTTPLNLDFLRSKFAGRVISHKTDLPWPPNSPDLNPLDFFSGDTR